MAKSPSILFAWRSLCSIEKPTTLEREVSDDNPHLSLPSPPRPGFCSIRDPVVEEELAHRRIRQKFPKADDASGYGKRQRLLPGMRKPPTSSNASGEASRSTSFHQRKDYR